MVTKTNKKKKSSFGMLGKSHTKETRNKISETHKKNKKNKGQRHSIKTEFKKGDKPWNTGINGRELSKHYKIGSVWNKGKKGYEIHSDEHKEKLRKSFIGNKLREGIPAWNKGMTGLKRKPRSEEVKKRISDTLKNSDYYKSEKWIQTKKNISIAKKKFLKENPEHLKAILERLKRTKTPKQDSTIEVKIQTFLKELGIEFFTHQYMKIEHGYLCDILIPCMNLVIECDGDYWHKYPIGLDRDHIRTKELIEKGFKVLRLWEFEIRAMDVNQFKNKLMEVNK